MEDCILMGNLELFDTPMHYSQDGNTTKFEKQIMKKHGLALVVIIVLWEIIEDVLFPVLFAALGKYVHPAFYSGIPAAWVLCLHWLAVPIMWKIWIKISNKNVDADSYKC